MSRARRLIGPTRSPGQVDAGLGADRRIRRLLGASRGMVAGCSCSDSSMPSHSDGAPAVRRKQSSSRAPRSRLRPHPCTDDERSGGDVYGVCGGTERPLIAHDAALPTATVPWRRWSCEAVETGGPERRICCPRVQDLALEILGAEDPFDAGRLVGKRDRERRLCHGAILHDGRLARDVAQRRHHDRRHLRPQDHRPEPPRRREVASPARSSTRRPTPRGRAGPWIPPTSTRTTGSPARSS